MGLVITDSFLLQLDYEISQWQNEEPAGDVIRVLLQDNTPDEYTKGYLSCTLEQLEESYSDEELMREFHHYLLRVKK